MPLHRVLSAISQLASFSDVSPLSRPEMNREDDVTGHDAFYPLVKGAPQADSRSHPNCPPGSDKTQPGTFFLSMERSWTRLKQENELLMKRSRSPGESN